MSGREPIFFAGPEEFYAWLEEHHGSEDEVYVGLYKKHTGKPSLTWSDAVDQALCFGWIDGRANRIDDDRWMQRFTPRRRGSNWSKINVDKVARLREAGLMRPAGLRAYEERVDGNTGVYSFEQRETAELPPEFEQRLRSNATAWEDWSARPPSYREAATWWIVSAKKEETRERRVAQLIESSAAGREAPPFVPRRGKRT